MNSVIAIWTVTLALGGQPAVARPGSGVAANGGNPIVQNCTVALIEEVQIPAQEAGALVKVAVHEGDQIKIGDMLAQMDDSQPKVHKKAATGEYEAARQHAINDINVRFAKAAYEVAKSEYSKALEANRRSPNAFSDVELDNKRLAAEKAKLQIEQSDVDQKVAVYTSATKEAEVENAQLSIDRRQIKSQIEGIVVSINRHAGEWLQVGEPVLRIVRMDRLWVEGWIDASKFNPDEIKNQSAVIDVELARGQHARFTGKIVFVSPLVEAGGEYRIKAEVENRRENNEWVLRPGHTATMQIQLK